MTLLNSLERLAVNNPVRALVQRRVEADWFIGQGGVLPNQRVLEIGCGRGVGIQIIFDTFGARHIDAFDLDPKMVEAARQTLSHFGDKLSVSVGDATHINAPDSTYDAVFDFAIIHHIPNWRDALKEIHRVLRPGGKLFASEVLRDFISHPIWRRVFDHPQSDRFDVQTFSDALTSAGFRVHATKDFYRQAALFYATKPT
jgi:ubiquinone/menaquinone biosynthesis C-methylase UbiE